MAALLRERGQRGGNACVRHAFAARLLLGDAAVCVAAVVLAYAARAGAAELGLLGPMRHSLATYLQALPIVLLVWAIAFDSMGLYRGRRSAAGFSQFAAVFKAVSLVLLVLMALSYLRKYDYSRGVMVLFWVAGVGLASAFRGAMSRIRLRQLRRGVGTSRAAIVGCNQLGGTVLAQMLDVADFGYRPVGFVRRAPAGEARFSGLPVLGHIAELPRLIPEHDIHEVFVAEPGMPPAELLDIVSQCEELPVVFRVVSGPMGALAAAMDLNGVGDLPVLTLRSAPFGAWQRAVKRAMDLSLGTTALAMSLPLFVIIAVLIRLTTRGPALFRQVRIGEHGKPFVMYKFRSMEPHEGGGEEGGRVTPIGRWLRKYSLDELPQLLNVLKGDMSLVGPRPELASIVARYEPWQRKRLEVKPGMTGLWQILGRKDLPLTENIHYDFYYIRNQSLLFDLAILLRTIPAVLSGKGAY